MEPNITPSHTPPAGKRGQTRLNSDVSGACLGLIPREGCMGGGSMWLFSESPGNKHILLGLNKYKKYATEQPSIGLHDLNAAASHSAQSDISQSMAWEAWQGLVSFQAPVATAWNLKTHQISIQELSHLAPCYGPFDAWEGPFSGPLFCIWYIHIQI